MHTHNVISHLFFLPKGWVDKCTCANFTTVYLVIYKDLAQKDSGGLNALGILYQSTLYPHYIFKRLRQKEVYIIWCLSRQ